jgi:diadenosine tetraphosphate (Ap4A) HIT family hydrolase
MAGTSSNGRSAAQPRKSPSFQDLSESIFDYDLELLPLGCTFCNQFQDGSSKGISGLVFGEDFDRILYQDHDFVIIPGLGQINEGYLLIVPRKHIWCIRDLPKQLHTPFLALKERVKSILENEYSSPIVFFEHGVNSSRLEAGACIEHAHFHALPCNADVQSRLMEFYPFDSTEGISNLWRRTPTTSNYLYFESEDGALYTEAKDPIPCQFFRRLLAEKLGKPDTWNWCFYMGTSRVRDVVTRLKGNFDD